MIQLYQTSSSAISGASTFNFAVVSKYGKVLIRKINVLIWFQHKEEEIQGAEGAHLSEPQKTHPTSEFTIVAVCCFIWSLACNCGLSE